MDISKILEKYQKYWRNIGGYWRHIGEISMRQKLFKIHKNI